jgi:DNA-binding transcriptional LysR family regulator
MEIRQLQLFVALAQEGSFTKAARRMNIVQSGLSVSIKELEQELGTRLFDRTTRRVNLTTAGSLFLDHVRASLIELQDGVQAVRSQDGIVRGRLHLGILQSLGPYLQLPLVLQRFRSTFPQIEFAVRAMSNDRIPADVRSGSVDLSFYAVIGKAEWPGVRVIPYAQDSLVAICSRNHRFASSKSVRLEMLSRESFVDLTADRALRKLVDHGFAQYHLKRSTVFEVSDIETALQFVGAGLGVAVVPSALARSSADLRQIHSLRIVDRDQRFPKWRIAILTRLRQKNLEGKSTVDLFLETLADLRAAQVSGVVRPTVKLQGKAETTSRMRSNQKT